MGAQSGFTVRWDTNRKLLTRCVTKNHLQRILFAKMLSEALKMSTFGKYLPRCDEDGTLQELSL